jgi:hypothetical protein
MRPQTRSKVLWALWMTGGGIATALVVWGLTDSLGWALVALLASGPVLNALGQMVVQPTRAARGAAKERDRGRTR